MKSRHLLRHTDERGIAMITTLLVLMLMSALLVGFTTVVMSDQRYRFIDRDRGQAFYAASAGIEKLTADLGNLFLENVAPTGAQVQALTDPAKMPVISGITFVAPQAPSALPASQLTDYHCIGRNPLNNLPTNTKTANTPVGSSGYMIRFCKLIATSNPTVSDDNLVISGTGVHAGMTALQTPYQLDVTAKTATGGEVHLSRTIQAVAIPVFQFGMFSETDLSFFPGANFSMGGRVHTNGNLWLAAGTGATLTMAGRITAFQDVIRQFLSNGSTIAAAGQLGTVSLATSAAAPAAGNRNLQPNEGSLVGMPGTAPTGNWQTISLGASPLNYNGYLRNGPTGTGALFQPGTGAKKLSLPLTATGVTGCFQAGVAAPCTNVEVVRRPLVGEDTAGILYNERLFTKASIRILLSDTAADITNIPGVTATAPVSLETNWNIAANQPALYGPLTLANPPIAMSLGAQMTTMAVAGTTITPVSPNLLRPTFKLSGAPANTISCTGKANVQLTGCNSAPGPMTVTALQTLTQYWPNGAPTGVSVQTVSTTAGANATITFASNAQRDLFSVGPSAFWNVTVNPPVLVSCTGATNTTFTGCGPAAGLVAGTIVSGYMSDPGVSTLGGFIKIERNNADGSGWTDVTGEILSYGIADTNPNINVATSITCGTTAATAPNAIVRLQRLRDNGGACNYTTAWMDPTNWWPNVLFDPREGLFRDSNYPGTTAGTPNLTLGGIMHYVNIDAGNLARWFAHGTAPFNVAGSTGNLSLTNGTGFSVYFSDRRNNRNAASLETGEYGYEDFVNPTSANGVPNGTLQTGEDVNQDGTLDVYGGTPNYLGTYNQPVPCAGCVPAYTAAVPNGAGLYPIANNPRPQTLVTPLVAQVNRPIIFRRALMLSNGAGIGATPVVADRVTGLTIVSENPVYVRGNWNAEVPAGTGFGGVNAASAIIADAVTLLSNAWTDGLTFNTPYVALNRPTGVNGWYRVAIIGGKGPAFPMPAVGAVPADFGTDGGTHNFLRYLEYWNGQTVNYLGSMATLYFNRQALGTYKCCTTVYGAPTRAYGFDTNFLTPALLPPLTPMFRDINVIGFSQELRPGR